MPAFQISGGVLLFLTAPDPSVFPLATPVIAEPLERLLGRTCAMAITRLLGMLLAALSVEFVIRRAQCRDQLTQA